MASTAWLQEWPDCRRLLLKRLSLEQREPWLLALPGVCCLAVGGTPADAIPVAAAAATLLQAAHTIDAVQDGGDMAMVELRTPAMATGLAAGLTFAAFRFLDCVQTYPGTVSRLTVLFSEAAFHASLGQYLDLAQDYGDLSKIDALETYWRTVIAKSGSLIRLAAAGGAAVGTNSEHLITALGEFGKCLGVILQVLDDCRDVLRGPDTTDCEISLPLLLLSMVTENSRGAEGQKGNVLGPEPAFSKETLLSVLREADIPAIITDVLLEWRRRALNSLAPLGSSEAVTALEGILNRILSSSPLADSGRGKVRL